MINAGKKKNKIKLVSEQSNILKGAQHLHSVVLYNLIK